MDIKWLQRSNLAWSGSTVAKTANIRYHLGITVPQPGGAQKPALTPAPSGVKQSGIGRELGEYAIAAYTNVKAVHGNDHPLALAKLVLMLSHFK